MSLNTRLATLEGAGLIQLAALQPELEYLFRHVLVKEAAYQSLVKADRRALHRAVAETLEGLYLAGANPAAAPARALPAALLPMLGLHFAEADDAPRALAYYTQAGDAAADVYANEEAISLYTQALGFAGPGLERERLVHLYTRRGRAMELSGQYAAAVANYEAMQAAAVALGDQSMEISALSLRATLHAIVSDEFDPARARQLAEPALARARAIGLPEAEARLLWVLLLLNMSEGRRRPAIVFGEQSLAIARRQGLGTQLAQTLTDLGRAYSMAGQHAAGRAAADEARRLWRAAGNVSMLAEATTTLATSYFFAGEYDAAMPLLSEAQALSRSIDNAWGQAYSLSIQCMLLVYTGLMSAGLAAMQACLNLSQAGGFFGPRINVRIYQGLTYADLGDTARALACAQAAVDAAEAHGSIEAAGVAAVLALIHVRAGQLETAAQELRRGYAGLSPLHDNALAPYLLNLAECELALALGENERVLTVSSRALSGLHVTGAEALVPDILGYRGRALLALGRLDEAEAELEQGRALAARQGARRSLWPILALLADLVEQRGHVDRARALRAEALALVDFIGEHIDEPGLRRSFLADPRVQGLQVGRPERAA